MGELSGLKAEGTATTAESSESRPSLFKKVGMSRNVAELNTILGKRDQMLFRRGDAS